MLVESRLHFAGYEVNNLQFKLNKEENREAEFKICPAFTKEIEDNGDGTYDVRLIVSIESTKEKPMLFDLVVDITGHFVLADDSGDEEFREQIINQNTVAILFPFLRTIVASLTTTANVSALMLPIINLSAAFDAEQNSEEKKLNS